MPSRVCVFCGSSFGANPAYLDAARAMGHALVDRGLGLVYGGGRVGLMGVVADAVIERGGEAIGVIPRALAAREIAHAGLTTLHVVESMHERKAKMAALAGGFIALPGGFGTYEELFEAITWTQLGVHRKPCGLLNVAGFYDPVIRLIDHAVAEQFIRPEHRSALVVETDPGRLLDALAGAVLAEVPKWIGLKET